MEKFEKESCAYWWETVIGKELECQQKCGNATDAFAAAALPNLPVQLLGMGLT